MITNFKIFENHYENLIHAVKSEKIKNVRQLIDSNFDVNFKDGMGWTPLLWSTYLINKRMIKLLIDSGADMSYKALHYINKTKKMVDFYDLCVDKYKYEKDRRYKYLMMWIEDNYPEFVASKKYNI
jgi:hypothetical protein